uniref:alpha/beta hydrolase family protein n=1 Tax=Sphingomonas bacterium TaxID=1895847 RepID=UPI0015764B9E
RGEPRPLGATLPYPSAEFVTPRPVGFTAPDGTAIRGQLFAAPGGAARKPAIVFVHGGPERQMLLGWHYRDYYANAYAVNQYLASRGFVVLSVNYRLGIGQGRAFEQPGHAGADGAAEYQDVLAGARYLQSLASVDGARIGIWGGSYGGYLTALALARNSDTFKAGVDFQGVHDWSLYLAEQGGPAPRFEQGDRDMGMKTAFQSSPVAAVAGWRSPVLLIQGDDDRNVRFSQTIDLATRLTRTGAPVETLVLPDETHGFARHASWVRADAATVAFFERSLRR